MMGRRERTTRCCCRSARFHPSALAVHRVGHFMVVVVVAAAAASFRATALSVPQPPPASGSPSSSSSSSSSSPPSWTTMTTTSSSGCPSFARPVCLYHELTVPVVPPSSSPSSSPPPLPQQRIDVKDLTPALQRLLEESSLRHGTLTVVSRHTTTAVTINEMEVRLADDVAEFLFKLAPPDERSVAATGTAALFPPVRYRHNDIHLRPGSAEETKRCQDNGWDVENDPTALKAWRDQEPVNAHSHLLAMVLGTTESIPVVDGQMVLGKWQSVLLVDLDGPRDRTVGVHLMGYQ